MVHPLVHTTKHLTNEQVVQIVLKTKVELESKLKIASGVVLYVTSDLSTDTERDTSNVIHRQRVNCIPNCSTKCQIQTIRNCWIWNIWSW